MTAFLFGSYLPAPISVLQKVPQMHTGMGPRCVWSSLQVSGDIPWFLPVPCLSGARVPQPGVAGPSPSSYPQGVALRESILGADPGLRVWPSLPT